MIVTLQTERLRTMEQVRAFVEGSEPVDYQPKDRASAYAFVRRTLAAFDYHRLGRADRGCVRAYIGKACGFSAAQISRLIRQQAETGAVVDRRARNSGRPFETVYAAADIRLLAEVDEAFGGMSGLATCEILRRARDVHGDARFERLADVSRSHLYNLRATRTYRTKRTTWAKTRPSPVAIGVRKAPEPNGQPGFLRVDTVHLGDRGRAQGRVRRQRRGRGHAVRARWRGAGHLGAVHGSGAGSAAAPVPVRRAGLPRRQRLRVRQPPRRQAAEQAARRVHEVAPAALQRQRPSSRARTPTWCAGIWATSTSPSASPTTWTASPARACRRSSTSTAPACSPPSAWTPRARCGEPTAATTCSTPLEKLKSLPGAASFLREGAGFADLDRAAAAQTDMQAAKSLNRARDELFRKVHGAVPAAA